MLPRTTLRSLGLLCIVACSSGTSRSGGTKEHQSPPPQQEPRVAAPPDATAPRPARPPRRPVHDTELHALQARLGASAITCSGTATILAGQGNASPATVKWRQTNVQRLCVEDRWPQGVRQCVATADHDPLSCTGHLETDDQRTRWNAVFDRWIESAGH